MIKTEENLITIIEKGQSGIYDKNAWLIRQFAGSIRTVIKLKNPLDGELLLIDIDKYLQIINPEFSKEIQWFYEAQDAIKLWINDIVIRNRILGIKNDNSYDTTEFERAIMDFFCLAKKPKPNSKIETDFKTMVEMVEMGARRFGRK